MLFLKSDVWWNMLGSSIRLLPRIIFICSCRYSTCYQYHVFACMGDPDSVAAAQILIVSLHSIIISSKPVFEYSSRWDAFTWSLWQILYSHTWYIPVHIYIYKFMYITSWLSWNHEAVLAGVCPNSVLRFRSEELCRPFSDSNETNSCGIFFFKREKFMADSKKPCLYFGKTNHGRKYREKQMPPVTCRRERCESQRTNN